MAGNPSWNVFRLTAGQEDAGTRLDHWLAARLPALSRSRARQLIDVGGVHLNGRRMRRCSQPVQPGDRAEVYEDGLPLEPFVLAGERILFRDDYLLVLDKPSGLDTQPTPARFKGTLYQAILDLLERNEQQKGLGLGMVQRLDRDTSGVMAFSLHPRAHRSLTLSFSERQVEKRYQVLVAGNTQASGEIRSLLARRRSDNLVHAVERGGKPAVTRFCRREAFGVASLLEVELLTGRSHQIRAHFSGGGHPVLGDRRYGGPVEVAGVAVPRQMVHAWRLQLAHPVSGTSMTFEAPLPTDMVRVLDGLRSSLPPTA